MGRQRPLNHRLTGLAPTLPSVVIFLDSSSTCLGQALGAISGGLLLAHHATAASLCVAGAALCLQILTSRAIRGGVPTPR